MKGSNAISASVSPDGKYLFFSARITSEEMKERSTIIRLFQKNGLLPL